MNLFAGNQSWLQEPLPFGGLQEPLPFGGVSSLGGLQTKNPEEEDPTWRTTHKIHQNLIDLGFVLQAGSSSSGFLVFKPPNEETTPGEVFSSLISPFVNIKDNLDITVNKILYRWLLLLNSFCFCET